MVIYHGRIRNESVKYHLKKQIQDNLLLQNVHKHPGDFLFQALIFQCFFAISFRLWGQIKLRDVS